MIPSSDQLMAEMAWMRRLARALAGSDADDIAQDAWLIANEQRPAEDRPLRPWLARVVVNLARTRRRSDVRRRQRDAAFDGDRSVPTPDELVERVELHRAVTDEVLALSEPYRTTVVLHFVEGLGSAEIARRLQIPDGTVRRRLKVALHQLREALARRTDQPKRGWLAALAPFATPSPGALAMKKTTALVIAAIAIILAISSVIIWRRGGTDASVVVSKRDPHHAQRAGALDADPEIPAWLAQAGVPARRVAGHVMAGGAPVSGASVRLGLFVWVYGNLLQPIAEVISGADGSFDFGTQPAAAFVASASAADHAPASIPVTTADPNAKLDQLVIELGDCRARLSGTISDASGGAIDKARVTVTGLGGTDADASGRYALCISPIENYGSPGAIVRIEADGYGTVDQRVLAVGELALDFTLVPEAIIVGHVSTGDQKPVAGARVVAIAESAGGPRHGANVWTISDRDGAFRIAGLAPGGFQLSAVADGLGIAAPVATIARPTTSSHDVKLTLQPRTRVRGQVMQHGTPIAGVAIAATRDNELPTPSVISQRDGTFVLDGVPHGPVRFLASPWVVATPASIVIGDAPISDVRLEIEPLATVRGHVTRAGRPAAGAVVTCMPCPMTAHADATGAFVLEGLMAGDLRLVAWDFHGKAFSPWQTATLAPGEDKAVDFDLSASGEVTGTVVDERGAVVPGVYVRLDLASGADDNCEATTDAAGRFDCAMLIGGAYLPTVSPRPGGRQGFAPADHYAPIEVPAAGVVDGVTIAIANERLAVRGSVIDDAGTPMPDVLVEAIGRGRSTMDFPSATSDATGHFEISNLARGSYNVHAHAADGSETEVVGIAAGSETSLKLARAGAIDGTLIGFSMTPVVETNTFTVDLHNTGVAIVDGTTFSEIGLSPGRYTVQARVGAEIDAQTVDIHPGETVHVTLRSRGIGSVEGTVLDSATRAPLAGMRCDANLSVGGQMPPGPPDPSRQAFTDAAGHFVVKAPIGRTRIYCFSPTGEPRSVAGTDVDVTTGAQPSVTVFSVRGTFGGAPGDAGFTIMPMLLPITVNQSTAAAIHAGDHVVSIDGAPLDGFLPDGAVFLIANHRSGSTVAVGIERGGVAKVISLSVH